MYKRGTKSSVVDKMLDSGLIPRMPYALLRTTGMIAEHIFRNNSEHCQVWQKQTYKNPNKPKKCIKDTCLKFMIYFSIHKVGLIKVATAFKNIIIISINIPTKKFVRNYHENIDIKIEQPR